MKTLMIAQNEYVVLDNHSEFKAIGTFELIYCIALVAFSPKTQKRLFVHVDNDSSHAEIMTILRGFADPNLRVSLVLGNAEEQVSNSTLEKLKQNLRDNNIAFSSLKTKTGICILDDSNTVQIDFSLDKVNTKYCLTRLQRASRVFEDDLHFSQPNNVQASITNLNCLLDQPKPLHCPLTAEGTLKPDPEKLHIDIVNFMREMRNELYPNEYPSPNLEEILYNKLWAKWGEIRKNKTISENRSIAAKHIASMSLFTPPQARDRMIAHVSQTVEVQLTICIKAQKTSFKFLTHLMAQLFPQLLQLEARHHPTESNGDPTTSFHFFAPYQEVVPFGSQRSTCRASN